MAPSTAAPRSGRPRRSRKSSATPCSEASAGGDPPRGFDLGNSPLEYPEPRAGAAVLTTTNGTRAVVQAAANCDLVLVGSMLNLDQLRLWRAPARRGRGGRLRRSPRRLQRRRRVLWRGRIAALVGGEPSPAAEKALELGGSFPTARRRFAPFAGSERPSPRKTSSGARGESVTSVVARFDGMRGTAARMNP
jgi:2-phosphosulpholactate phosphatase